jgi:hypothetical protein
VLGALGKREREAGDTQLTERERPIVRRQVVKVVVQSAAIAAVITAVLYFV